MKIRNAQQKIRNEARRSFPGESREVIDSAKDQMSIQAQIACSTRSMQKLFSSQKTKVRKEVGDDGLDALPTANIIIPNRLLDIIVLDEMIGESRILVFGSHKSLEILSTCNDISFDGTFKVENQINCSE